MPGSALPGHSGLRFCGKSLLARLLATCGVLFFHPGLMYKFRLRAEATRLQTIVAFTSD